MKVSKAAAAKNRERIVKTAAKRFREKGLQGIGLADLMSDAGLTHGGFYGHFTSKEHLVTEALARCFSDKARQWKEVISRNPPDPLLAVLKVYFSKRHIHDHGWGCPMAALGPEIARQPADTRKAFTEGFLSLVETIAPAIPGKTPAIRRRKALAVWSTLVGAILLARAVDDPKLAREILAAASESLTRSGG